MRAMPIQVNGQFAGLTKLKAAFRKNYRHYFQEALGLGIFMISSCFFGSMLFSSKSSWVHAIPDSTARNILMGLAMGSTALFIFYSPFTSPSGSQINPAVTLSFLRIGKMCPYDALFFIFFQVAGGVSAVFLMQLLMGSVLVDAPVRSVVTVPGKYGAGAALVTELFISFITMSMVLFTSHHARLKKYTRLFAALLVCTWVLFAGPLSGFGMNPARSLSSAWPSGIWTSFWIYLFVPLTGMWMAAECWLLFDKKKANNHHPEASASGKRKTFMEPLEFML